MKIVIITVGKKNSPLKEAIDDYLSRINKTDSLKMIYLPSVQKEPNASKQKESLDILAKLKANDTLWLLDETGQQISSTALASKLNVLKVNSASRLVIVIGGAYGVDDKLKNRANWVWSLSKMVFPHQIVRLLLVEQIYRALEINKGSPYHHV